jgi:hypothetical protein
MDDDFHAVATAERNSSGMFRPVIQITKQPPDGLAFTREMALDGLFATEEEAERAAAEKLEELLPALAEHWDKLV